MASPSFSLHRTWPLVALVAPCVLACGSVVLEDDTGGHTGTSTTTSEGGGGAAGSTVTATGASGGAGGGSTGSAGEAGSSPGVEKVADVPNPALLRINSTGVFVQSYGADGPTILRFDKETGAKTIVTQDLPKMLDYAVTDDTVFVSEAGDSCLQCPPPTGFVNAIPLAGGPPALIATQDAWVPQRIAVCTTGLFLTDGWNGVLHRLPLGGGTPEVVQGVFADAGHLACSFPWVHYLSSSEDGFKRYDETTGDVLFSAPPASYIRGELSRGGALYWLAEYQPSHARSAHGDQLFTIATFALDDAHDIVVNADSAFIVTTLSPADPGYPHGDLWRVPLPSGEPEKLADHLPQPKEVEVDETHVYWITSGLPDEEVVGALWRIPLPE